MAVQKLEFDDKDDFLFTLAIYGKDLSSEQQTELKNLMGKIGSGDQEVNEEFNIIASRFEIDGVEPDDHGQTASNTNVKQETKAEKPIKMIRGARVKRIGCYSVRYPDDPNQIETSMLVGVANIPDVFVRKNGEFDLLDQSGETKTKVPEVFFSKILSNDVNEFPFTWVIVPLQELSQGRFKVHGMGGHGKG